VDDLGINAGSYDRPFRNRFGLEVNTMFHEFTLTSRKTGNKVPLTHIGKDRDSAREHLKRYSLKDLDWDNWSID
jgi:hypothetical protein